MSLQVWLPLNGDFKNQGLSGTLTCPNALTFTTDGKIGNQCLNSNTGYFTVSAMDNKKQMSFAYWIKINEGTSTNWKDTFTWYTTDGSTNTQSRQEFYNWDDTANTMTTGVWYAGGSNSSHQNQIIGQWAHYAFTIDYATGETKFYINGILKKTNNTANTSHYIAPGASFRLRENTLNSSINDFRLYDHILSAKEVEELAKGLVLHYRLAEKLLSINTSNYQNLNNCYNYPTFNTSNANGGWSHWGRTGASGTQGQNTNKKFIYNQQNTYSHWVKNAGTATGEYLLYQSPAFDGGFRSLQAIIKEENSSMITEDICFPAWNARNGGATQNLWTNISYLGNGFYLCQCEGISQDGSNDLVGIYVKPGYKVYFSEVYLENNQSVCTNILNLSSTIIQDYSGNKNNATIINTLQPDTSFAPRYNASSNFNGTTRIKRDSLGGEIKTLSCWAKTSKNKSTSQQLVSDSNSALTISYYQGTIIGVFGTTRSTGSKSILGNEYKENDWNHFVVVKTSDDGKRDIYCNGIKLTPTSNDYWTAAIGFYIGARNDSQGNPFYGNIVDVRAYAAALTEEQVQELYRTSYEIVNGQKISRS